MNEWKKYKLGELGTVVTGKTPSKNNPEDWGNQMPFVTPSDYKNYGKFAETAERNISQLGINRLKGKVLPSNSILVTCIGSDMGKVVVNKTEVITNQQINAIIPNSKVDSNFLYYRLVSMYEILRIYGGDGTAVPIVNKGDFENIDTELPSLPEQQSIASILSSLDDKIDLLNRQNATLEKMAETLFRKWFVEEAKEEWEEGSVSDTAIHLKNGINPQKFTNTTFKHYSIPAFDNDKEPITELGSEIQSGKYKIPNYCILFSKLNPHKDKRIWLLLNDIDEFAICSTEFQIIKPKRKEYIFFIYGWLSYKENYNEIASGVGGTSGSHQRIDPATIFLFNCPKINVDYIESYNQYVQPLFEKQNNNQTQIRNLTALRDILLPRLMGGEALTKKSIKMNTI